MNTKRKGTRAEHRAMRILEAAGYVCTRAGASLGLFDVIAIGPNDVRLLQVKAREPRIYQARSASRSRRSPCPQRSRKSIGGSRTVAANRSSNDSDGFSARKKGSGNPEPSSHSPKRTAT
jgi:hypothetical protein